jgi:hypothetical protein
MRQWAEAKAAEAAYLSLLSERSPFLLGMPVRLCHLSELHAREFMGHDLQRHHLGMP